MTSAKEPGQAESLKKLLIVSPAERRDMKPRQNRGITGWAAMTVWLLVPLAAQALAQRVGTQPVRFVFTHIIFGERS